MIGTDQPDRHTTLRDLERFLSGDAPEAVGSQVVTELRDSESHLRQLVDFLASQPLIPSPLWEDAVTENDHIVAVPATDPMATTATRRPTLAGFRMLRTWGGFSLAASVLIASLVGIWGWSHSSQAVASVRAQFARSSQQVDDAFALVDCEDYTRAEQMLVETRETLDHLQVDSDELSQWRSRLLARVWAVQAVVQAQHRSFDAARASLRNAHQFVTSSAAETNTSRDQVITRAFVHFAVGRVQYQTGFGFGNDQEKRWLNLADAQESFRESLHVVQVLPESQRRPSDSLLVVRILSSLAIAIHKGSRYPADEQPSRLEAIRLCDQAIDLLKSIPRTDIGDAWNALYVQLYERRGLSLVALRRNDEAVRQYEEAIRLFASAADLSQLSSRYQLGILHGNLADALSDAHLDPQAEVVARTHALDHLTAFWTERGTRNAAMNLRLNFGRRAVAHYRLGERRAAVADAIAYASVTEFKGREVELSQINATEVTRIQLLLALYWVNQPEERERFLANAEATASNGIQYLGCSRESMVNALQPYWELKELADSPIFQRMRTEYRDP